MRNHGGGYKVKSLGGETWSFYLHENAKLLIIGPVHVSAGHANQQGSITAHIWESGCARIFYRMTRLRTRDLVS